MKNPFIAACLCLISASPAHAAPAYLTCDMTSTETPFSFNVTVDEQAGTADLFFPHSGSRQRLAATFTSDRVLFGDRMISYTINRVDMTLVRVTPIIKSTDQGLCKIQPAAKRAF